MNKYMVLYLAPIDAAQQMQNATPEQAAEGMALWEAWFAKNGAAIIEGGAPLGKGRRFTPSDSAPAQTTVAGYSVLQAADMDSIQAILKGHPHYLMPGASIEVLEIMPMS